MKYTLLFIVIIAGVFIFINHNKILLSFKQALSSEQKHDEECIFCQIIHNKAPAEFVLKGKSLVVIRDIDPKANTHVLIIPKKHIRNMKNIDAVEDEFFWQELLTTIQYLASKLTDEQSFTLKNHNEKEAKQTVFHLHWHFLSKDTLALADR